MTATDARLAERRVLIPRDIATVMKRPPRGAEVVALRGETMGTSWSVRLVPPSPASTALLRDGIVAVLDGVIAEMSTWIAHSDISRFNDAAAGTWHTLPDDLRDVLRCALSVAAQSAGAYDPTVGALVDLWGFGPFGVPNRPSDAAIEAARARCGWRRIKLDGARAFQPGGMRIDLSSVAKGFAVDKVSAWLASRGIVDHIVEIGGELRGHGTKPDGNPWWVALEGPAETLVALHSLSIATSGDSQRFFDNEGRRFSHTIDPRKGYPVNERVASVTVLHRRCMHADALASALLVLGAEAGLAFSERQGIAARFIVRNGAALGEQFSSAMMALLDE